VCGRGLVCILIEERGQVVGNKNTGIRGQVSGSRIFLRHIFEKRKNYLYKGFDCLFEVGVGMEKGGEFSCMLVVKTNVFSACEG